MRLSAAYNQEQEYYYEFKGNKNLDDYVVSEIYVNGVEAEQAEGAKGSFIIPKGEAVSTKGFTVSVGITAKDVLEGDEALELKISNEPEFKKGERATAAIKNFDDCGIDGLVQNVEATGACIADGEANKATFDFVAELDTGYNNRGQDFSYRFDANKALADGYEVTAFYVNGEKQDGPAKQGSFEIPSNNLIPVSTLKIQVDVQATDQLDGTEALSLTLDNTSSPAGLTDDSPSATAKFKNFDECSDVSETSDVALYLLMDNSTSMLQPDPSTEKASRSNRLEAQDRVALYAYKQALAKAGYGFSRKGSGEVLGDSDFTDAVINNSAGDLSKVLSDFKVIADPDRSGGAQAVTVHLIQYGYAVDYGKVSFNAGDTEAALTAAKTILDVSTPDQEYGNSIVGNGIWKSRNLPKPTANDYFKGKGRPSSNLYSGTEMLGALTGLENLLRDQVRNAGADQPITLISMFTDGRPERRAWWAPERGRDRTRSRVSPFPCPIASAVMPSPLQA